jgi:hypothetical protein
MTPTTSSWLRTGSPAAPTRRPPRSRLREDTTAKLVEVEGSDCVHLSTKVARIKRDEMRAVGDDGQIYIAKDVEIMAHRVKPTAIAVLVDPEQNVNIPSGRR